MALIGTIRHDSIASGVDLDRWRAMVKSSAHLVSASPREIVNPFTGMPTIFVPPDTDGYLVHGGSQVGTITASDAVDGELDVWTNSSGDARAIVETIAQSVATELNATYFAIPDDPNCLEPASEIPGAR